jgi:lytTr DNA-binding domain
MEKYGKIKLVNGVSVVINFVICEDEKDLRENNKKEIVKFMMNYDIDYKIHEYSGYTQEFNEYAAQEDGFKIYLLDIVTQEGSGIDSARMIREKYEALSSRLYLLDFINKLNKFDKTLRDDLLIAMKHYDRRYKTLGYEYNHTYYRIELKQIIWIEKEPDSKRCIIKTKYGEEMIPGTLNSIYEKLDSRFFKTHKSLIVNLDEVQRYEIRRNKLTFKNGEHTHLIARDKKKELIKRVCANY